MKDKLLRRALPKDPWVLTRALVPTRASVEVRLYDYETQNYRYIPARIRAVIASEQELRRLWRLIQRVIKQQDQWRDADSPLLQRGEGHDDSDEWNSDDAR